MDSNDTKLYNPEIAVLVEDAFKSFKEENMKIDATIKPLMQRRNEIVKK